MEQKASIGNVSCVIRINFLHVINRLDVHNSKAMDKHKPHSFDQVESGEHLARLVNVLEDLETVVVSTKSTGEANHELNEEMDFGLTLLQILNNRIQKTFIICDVVEHELKFLLLQEIFPQVDLVELRQVRISAVFRKGPENVHDPGHVVQDEAREVL